MVKKTKQVSLQQEKEKARELRQSQWWKNKLLQAKCYYCEKKLASKEVTMDHVVPLSQGGKSIKSNLVVACKDCNNKKKNMTTIEWLKDQGKL
tara:strand:- start:64 stop:342 length:279 start_codon:yes stop_codon:yes gene_type:complete